VGVKVEGEGEGKRKRKRGVVQPVVVLIPKR
jgi:hypothetical protein